MTAPASLGRTARHRMDLATVLIQRDLRANFGGSLLGLLWSPLAPLVQVAALGFLFGRVVPLGIADYPVFLYTGLLSWHLAVGVMTAGADAFVGNRDLVRRPGFPISVLPVIGAGGPLVGYGFGLPIVLAFLAVSDRLTVRAVLVPAVLVVQLAILVGPAYVVGTLNVRFRDVRHLVGIGLGIVFYLTPVFYETDRIPDRYQSLMRLNPLAVPVRLHRQILYEGRWPDGGLVLAGVALAAASVIVALLALHRSAHALADEL